MAMDNQVRNSVLELQHKFQRKHILQVQFIHNCPRPELLYLVEQLDNPLFLVELQLKPTYQEHKISMFLVKLDNLQVQREEHNNIYHQMGKRSFRVPLKLYSTGDQEDNYTSQEQQQVHFLQEYHNYMDLDLKVDLISQAKLYLVMCLAVKHLLVMIQHLLEVII